MQVFDRVSDILRELSGVQKICLESKLQEDLALDSLMLVTLLILLEEAFQIILDEADMNPFDLVSVENVVGLVNKYVGGDINEEEN